MSEKPCPNCGHCPTCGRSNARPSPYPVLPAPYYPGRHVTTWIQPNQVVGSADYLSRLTNAGTNAQNVTVTASPPDYVSGGNEFWIQ